MPETRSRRKRKRGDETQRDDEAREPPSKSNKHRNEKESLPRHETPKKAGDGNDDREEMGKGKAEEPHKVFNDSVHGHIEIHPLCVKIIDTPQFQRLRDIKQLGGCYFVFPGASHNRFEHSIGTCYLAGKLVEGLRHNQPQLGISNKDVLCVKIAGLCHDLGHGPFSHMFDASFIPAARGNNEKWKHEDGSLDMFEHLMKANNMPQRFKEYGLKKKDQVFIKELITGKRQEKTTSKDWQFKGRGKEKSFLYEIVANKRTGIDVDKFDYFARDCHGLGIKNSFDHERYMKFAKVLKVNGVKRICVRDKEVNNICDMFHARSSLHRRAYQHKTSNIIEIMIKEALLLADKKVLFTGDKKMLSISGCIDDMVAYTKLSDNVYYQILYSSNPDGDHDLEKARDILRRIQNRNLYRCIGQTRLANEMISNIKKDMEKSVAEWMAESVAESVAKYNDNDLKPEDFVTDVVKFDYGMKEKNPLDELWFYNKSKPDEAFPFREIQVSHMLPEKFQELHLRVYFRKNDNELLVKAKGWFEKWQKENLQGGDTQGDQILRRSPEEEGGLNASQERRGGTARRNLHF